MDCLTSCLGTIFAECGKHLCGPVCLTIKNVFMFGSIVNTLDKDFKSLSDMKNRIKEVTELAEVDGMIRTPQVETWLNKIEEIEHVVTSIQAEVTANKEKVHGCCLNCCLRYRLSRQVVEKLQEVKQILNESTPDPLVMVDPRLKVVELQGGPSITRQKKAKENLEKVIGLQKKAKENLEKVIGLLNDDKVRTIGIWGMGGVGKTTLVQNLNNELKTSTHDFGVVIWITVSKGSDDTLLIKCVQNEIAKRLHMWIIDAESLEEMAGRLSDRLMEMKKFLLILDDVWDPIDLEKVGVPRPECHSGYKVLLTTRFQDVCREILVDEVFPVVPLSDKEAWELFSHTAGEVVNLKHVKPFAKDLAKECAGLPLALLTVGKAMRGKSRVEFWKDALRALRNSNPIPHIKGVEEKMFSSLKLSYDSLEGNKNIKACFLYCCLYREDFSIEVKDLIRCWIAEGFLDDEEDEDHETVYNTGIAVIENLKDTCLLESGAEKDTVRMHDVVRDFAIWIASSLEDGEKSLVCSGHGLSKITGVETWASYRRVSYMDNRIEFLPDCLPKCSPLSTLFLQGNRPLTNVPSEFLEGFQGLRVLNLSGTDIKSLPVLKDLGELRVLLLTGCKKIREFDALRPLSRLQVLDISDNDFAMSINEEGLMLKEVRLLEHLLEFYVDLKHVPSITFEEDSAWLRRLKRFKICIYSTPSKNNDAPHGDERVIYVGGKICSSQGIMVLLSSNASALFLEHCEDMTELWIAVREMGGLDCLKCLHINNCTWTGYMGKINDDARDQVILPSLEVLYVIGVGGLLTITRLLYQLGTNIKIIRIEGCRYFKRLFLFDMLYKLENLEEIYVSNCGDLVEMITDDHDSTAVPNALPNLRVMELKKLHRLDSVCQQVITLSSLNRIEVTDCPNLKKLPLSSQHASTIEVIKGEQSWWNNLELEDDTKSSLQQKFTSW